MEVLAIILLFMDLGGTAYLVAQKFLHGNERHGTNRKVFVDTSALIDGRILAVAKTGFIGYDLVIPRGVIRELQLLADGKDSEKRVKARQGLDIVNELERITYFNTEIMGDPLDRTPVDELLLKLAKEEKGLVMTVDFNLIKVAQTEKIETLNINDLALAMQNTYMPGDKLKIKITAKGSGAEQGIGHLPDGLMVVVDKGEKKIGHEVEVEVLRFMQSETGRILFTKIATQRRRKQK